jgi:hypothetical protein
MSTFMHTLLFEVLSHSREPVYPRWVAPHLIRG